MFVTAFGAALWMAGLPFAAAPALWVFYAQDLVHPTAPKHAATSDKLASAIDSARREDSVRADALDDAFSLDGEHRVAKVLRTPF